MCGVMFLGSAADAAGAPLSLPAHILRTPPGPGKTRASWCGKFRTPPVEFHVPGRAEMLALIRSRVVEFARSMPFSEEEIDDIKLAVGEASANAIRHGAAAASCKVAVKMERRPRCLKVSIADQGCGFDPSSVPTPAPGALVENGRGIMLMRALVDEVKFHFARPGTRVVLTKRLKPHYS